MTVQFSKWGNSIAIRVPASFLKEIGAGEGMHANLTIEDGKLILAPVYSRPSYTLDELLAGITEENCHEDIDFGPPVGSEIW